VTKKLKRLLPAVVVLGRAVGVSVAALGAGKAPRYRPTRSGPFQRRPGDPLLARARPWLTMIVLLSGCLISLLSPSPAPAAVMNCPRASNTNWCDLWVVAAQSQDDLGASAQWWGDICQDGGSWDAFYSLWTCQWSGARPQYHNWQIVEAANYDSNTLQELSFGVWEPGGDLAVATGTAWNIYEYGFIDSTAPENYRPNLDAVGWANPNCSWQCGSRVLFGWECAPDYGPVCTLWIPPARGRWTGASAS
jgi:hypothetical protein